VIISQALGVYSDRLMADFCRVKFPGAAWFGFPDNGLPTSGISIKAFTVPLRLCIPAGYVKLAISCDMFRPTDERVDSRPESLLVTRRTVCN
jgi:hypothetical protein